MTNRAFYLPFLLPGVILLCLASEAAAQAKGARGILVEKIRNDNPSFYVRVAVDHADQTYVVGEEMKVTVSSEKRGYLYLFYLDAAGNISCLFPNEHHTDNEIPAGKDVVTVPAPGANFRLRIVPPCGRETLKAIVSLKPLRDIDIQKLIQGTFTAQDVEKGVAIEKKDEPNNWAEHYVEITTRQDNEQKLSRPQRVGVFVGIQRFKDAAIPELHVSGKDAAQMADVMKRAGKLDKSFVLLNEQATRAGVEDVFCHRLVDETKPGDEIFIYWSGHGWRRASTNPDKKNAMDEYLVPYDGSLDSTDAINRTMLLNDTFGVWMLKLSGRRIVVILDACYAAGQHNEAKSLSDPLKNSKSIHSEIPFDFFSIQRTKALGQKELAMLASSTASQMSWERKEGDLSAMTYFLIRRLDSATGPVSLADAYEAVKQDVPKYVEEQYPDAKQTPVLVDETTSPVYLRP